MRKALSIVVLLAALAAFMTACGGSDSGSSKPTVPSGDVAVVGNQKITQAQFDQLYASAVKQGAANGQKAPKAGSAEEKTLKQQVMQSLVQNAEIQQEADAKGIKVDQKKVQDDLKAFKVQCCQANQAKYQKYLTAQGLTEQQLIEQLTLRQEAQSLYDNLTKNVKVTDEEAQKQYDKDKAAKYTTAESRKVAHILLDVPPKGKATAADCVKADEVLKEVLANPNQWFVWHERAKYAEYGHKTLRVLSGVKPGGHFSREDCPYEVSIRKNADGRTYKVYARYVNETNESEAS
jgi:parvulin-like peptidyl-prolyl isomerase